jgi:hypothetical protein
VGGGDPALFRQTGREKPSRIEAQLTNEEEPWQLSSSVIQRSTNTAARFGSRDHRLMLRLRDGHIFA